MATYQCQFREQGRTGLFADLPLEPGPGVLVRHGDPVECRAPVIHGGGFVDPVVAEGPALRPVFGDGRHYGDGVVAGCIQIINQRGKIAGQEYLVIQLGFYPLAAEQAGVRQPGLAPLNRRTQAAGHNMQAGVRQCQFHLLQTAANQWLVSWVGDRRNAVGFDKTKDHIGVCQAGQSGSLSGNGVVLQVVPESRRGPVGIRRQLDLSGRELGGAQPDSRLGKP